MTLQEKTKAANEQGLDLFLPNWNYFFQCGPWGKLIKEAATMSTTSRMVFMLFPFKYKPFNAT